jgi:hypothetical protein
MKNPISIRRRHNYTKRLFVRIDLGSKIAFPFPLSINFFLKLIVLITSIHKEQIPNKNQKPVDILANPYQEGKNYGVYNPISALAV